MGKSGATDVVDSLTVLLMQVRTDVMERLSALESAQRAHRIPLSLYAIIY